MRRQRLAIELLCDARAMESEMCLYCTMQLQAFSLSPRRWQMMAFRSAQVSADKRSTSISACLQSPLMMQQFTSVQRFIMLILSVCVSLFISSQIWLNSSTLFSSKAMRLRRESVLPLWWGARLGSASNWLAQFLASSMSSRIQAIFISSRRSSAALSLGQWR